MKMTQPVASVQSPGAAGTRPGSLLNGSNVNDDMVVDVKHLPATSYQFSRNLSNQPNEIILMIAGYLSRVALNAWLQTSRRFWKILAPIFNEHIFDTRSDGKNAIVWAVQHGNIPCLRKALEYYTRDYLLGENGFDALHMASFWGQESIIRFLLDIGVDPNIPELVGNRRKQAPLFCASECRDNAAIVEMLLDAGADISATFYPNARVNYNALIRATTKGHTAIVKVLLKRGIDVNIKGGGEETALIRAALNGDSEIVRILLKARAKVDAVDFFGNTPLLCALREGHLKVAELLLAKGASVKSMNLQSKTPLHYAVWWGFFKVVRFLIRNGADINGGDHRKTEHTPLWQALKTRIKNIDVLKLLLRAGAQFPSFGDYDDEKIYSLVGFCGQEKFRLLFDYGAVPRGWKSSAEMLLSAAVHGNQKRARLHLQNGADLHATTLMRSTGFGREHILKMFLARASAVALVWKNRTKILRYAAEHGSATSVNMLLKMRPKIEYTREDLLSALIVAVTHRNTDIVPLFLQQIRNIYRFQDEDGKTVLQHAVEIGNCDILRKILTKSAANINFVDQQGNTPILLAIKNNNLPVAEILLDRGADIEYTNRKGQSALSLAAQWDNKALSELLIKRGANIYAQDIYSQTPLSIAATKDHTSIVSLLVERGAAIEHLDQKLRTPLMLAALNGSSDTVRLLLTKPLDINYTDDCHRTALSRASEKGHCQIIKLLLEYGADINLPDETGRTPLSYAIQFGNAEATKLLVRAGADVAKGDESGRTPLSWALSCNNDLMIKLLYGNA